MIAPAIVAAIALGPFAWVNDELAAGLVTTPTPIGPNLLAAEWQARFLWESTVVLLVVASIAAIVFSLIIIHRFLEVPTRHWVYGFMAGLSAVAIIAISLSDVSVEYTQAAILDPTIGAMADPEGTLFSVEDFKYSRLVTNGLVSVATLIFSFAMMACTTLASFPPGAADADDRKIDRHAIQMRALSALLYVGTFVLISLVLSMVAWLQWPAALLDFIIKFCCGCALAT